MITSPRRLVSLQRLGRALCTALAATFATVGAVQAQDDAPWTSPHPLKLSGARALAMVAAADRDLPYVPGEVLVRFKPGMTRTAQQRALRAVRSQPQVDDLRWIHDIAVLRDTREADATVLAAQLREQPEVLSAEPNLLHRLQATPNDPSFAERQWNLTALDMPRAWDINPGAASNVTVAVLDTGMNTRNVTYQFRSWNGTAVGPVNVPFAINPDLSAARVDDGADFVFWDGPVLDFDGHGTHVTGTVGQETNNETALAGMAYRATIMPLKVCIGFWEVQFILSAGGYSGFAPVDAGGCPDDATIEAVYYAADHGAKVLNLSLGGTAPSQALKEALIYAVEKGAFISIAAGNEFEDGNPVSYPAADAATIDGAMSVGAVGRELTHASYSNTGTWVEIAAPGGDIAVDAAEGAIWQVGLSPTDAQPHQTTGPRFDRYFMVGLDGTSMAAPHVAGLGALLYSQGVTKPAAIEALIKKTAKDQGEDGAGLIQPRAALFGLGVAK